MKRQTLEAFIAKLDGMIATFDQAVVIGGRTKKESAAADFLRDARLKILEDLDDCTLSLVSGRYQGRLEDGRVLCVLPDVVEMNCQLPESELFDPNEWLSSVDGANCWIE